MALTGRNQLISRLIDSSWVISFLNVVVISAFECSFRYHLSFVGLGFVHGPYVGRRIRTSDTCVRYVSVDDASSVVQ